MSRICASWGLAAMEATWRWFGPQDPVSLREARQAGARGIVSALHDFAPGVAWPLEAIEERRQTIEAAGLTWSVVESVNVSETIKRRTGAWREHIDAYITSLRRLAHPIRATSHPRRLGAAP